MKLMKVKNRTALVARALQYGLVSLPPASYLRSRDTRWPQPSDTWVDDVPTVVRRHARKRAALTDWLWP